MNTVVTYTVVFDPILSSYWQLLLICTRK